MAARVPVRLTATVASVGLLAGACSSGGSIELTATFDDVGDMVTQHSVQLADVRIGRITNIELTDDFRAKVTFRIDDDVKVPVDTAVFAAKTSLLGEKYLDLRPNGDPTEGPFLADGDDLGDGVETPELEFVAESAIELLAAVAADDLGTLVDSGALAFAGRTQDLRNIVEDLTTVSATLADRSGVIGRIIDSLDRTAGTLAAADGDVDALLVNLAETTEVLVDNRNRAVRALDELSRLAAAQNDILRRFRSDMERQIGQIDVILAEVASHALEVDKLLGFLTTFTEKVPLGIPRDFTQVFGWFVAPDGELEP